MQDHRRPRPGAPPCSAPPAPHPPSSNSNADPDESHDPQPAPRPGSYALRRLGRCPSCHREVRLTTTGVLYAHGACPPASPEALPDTSPAGSTPTAARAAWSSCITSSHRSIGEPCGCAPQRDPSDVTWTTAEELHRKRHPAPDAACTWHCEYIAVAAAHYTRARPTRPPSSRHRPPEPTPKETPMTRIAVYAAMIDPAATDPAEVERLTTTYPQADTWPGLVKYASHPAGVLHLVTATAAVWAAANHGSRTADRYVLVRTVDNTGYAAAARSCDVP
ncbi:hypothetical protein ACU686_26690 [Yinghuangia aomiensis]